MESEAQLPQSRWPRTTILPVSGWPLPDFRELYRYRELLGLLTLRHISVIYRQSVLGVSWAVIRPVITTIILTLVFGRFAGFDQSGSPHAYPLFVFSGLVIWNFFSSSLAGASESVVSQSNLLSKTYFPRLILPLSAVGVSSIDFFIQFAVLILIFPLFGTMPSPLIFLSPAFFVAAGVASLALSVWLTALNVRFRDVKHVVPFLTQTMFYVTPVIFPVSFVPVRWQWILNLNPMFSITQGFRWTMLGSDPPDWRMFFTSMIVSLIVLWAGLKFFRRTEATFADVI